MAKKKAAKKSAKKASKKSSKKAAKKSAKKSMGKMAKKAAKKVVKKAMKKHTPRKVSSRRELIDTGVDKRYVRRAADGTFKDVVDVSRSLAADNNQVAQNDAGPGQGDQGD